MSIVSGRRGRGLSVDGKAKQPEFVAEAAAGFTFGADPEMFVLNKEGVPVTADGLIPGTKAEPYKVKFGAVQVDGMAAEFNIDPVDNFNDWDRNFAAVINQLQNMLPEGYTLKATSAIRFGEEEFVSAPERAKELGCSPDFNAWTGEINPPPAAPDDPLLRTAAGHIHFGWGEDLDIGNIQHLTNCRDLVKQLDWYLGGWSVAKDGDPTRRKLYGKAGAMRPKDYGVEYRVLSNFWITKRDLRLQVWNRMQRAIEDMRKTFYPEQVRPIHNAKLVQAINDTTRNPVLEGEYPFPLQTIERPQPYVGRSKKSLLETYEALHMQAQTIQMINTIGGE